MGGQLRANVNSTKFRYGSLRRDLENETPVAFEYEEAPIHYGNCLHPNIIGNGFMLPATGRTSELLAKADNGEIMMRNRLGGPVRFWNGFNRKSAEKWAE